MALSGADQLRQITSWGLSQIISVGLPGSGMVFYEGKCIRSSRSLLVS